MHLLCAGNPQQNKQCIVKGTGGGPESIERVLRNLRVHASYAYDRIVSCINRDLSREVI